MPDRRKHRQQNATLSLDISFLSIHLILKAELRPSGVRVGIPVCVSHRLEIH